MGKKNPNILNLVQTFAALFIQLIVKIVKTDEIHYRECFETFNPAQNSLKVKSA